MFDRYKVFYAADLLQTFTVRDLAVQAVVSEAHVQKIIERAEGLFEPVGKLNSARGRPAVLYRVNPNRTHEIREALHAHRSEFRRAMGITEPEPVVEPVSPALARLRLAEYELSHRLAEAQNAAERDSILAGVRDMLVAVRKLGELTPEAKALQDRVNELLDFLSPRTATRTSVIESGRTAAAMG